MRCSEKELAREEEAAEVMLSSLPLRDMWPWRWREEELWLRLMAMRRRFSIMTCSRLPTFQPGGADARQSRAA